MNLNDTYHASYIMYHIIHNRKSKKQEQEELFPVTCSLLHDRRGFTLIELLVVVAIIGLLASVIVVATGNARLKARDAKRLSDIQQIKSGLNVYLDFGGGFPSTTDWNAAQSTQTQLACGSDDALKVPQDPLNFANPSFTYTYAQGGNSLSGCGGTVYSDYYVQFQLEGTTSYGPAGTYYLGQIGITSSAPF
jgi:prepilin-type N-terminal cleavage/methylation domain-containing protein